MINNVIDFTKELNKNHRKYNPAFSLQVPWLISTYISTLVNLCTIPLVIGEAYWSTFQAVYTPEGKE